VRIHSFCPNCRNDIKANLAEIPPHQEPPVENAPSSSQPNMQNGYFLHEDEKGPPPNGPESRLGEHPPPPMTQTEENLKKIEENSKQNTSEAKEEKKTENIPKDKEPNFSPTIQKEKPAVLASGPSNIPSNS